MIMTPLTTTNAKLEVIRDADQFARALARHNGELMLLIEWTLEKPQLCLAYSGEASQIFTQSFQKDPRHLHFRAFSAQAEYAWFGTLGVRVELTPEGNLEVEVEQQTYYAKTLEVDRDAQVCVQRLMCNGRAIYEKLLKVPTPSTVSAKAGGGKE